MTDMEVPGSGRFVSQGVPGEILDLTVLVPPNDLDALESLIPGIASLARGYTDVIEEDGSHTPKAGPCVRFDGLDQFARLRMRMDGCLTGSQLAKDRAAEALTKVMIPEALDYPA